MAQIWYFFNKDIQLTFYFYTSMYVGYAKRKRTVFCLSFINQYIMLICNNIQQNENTLIHGLVKYIIFYIKIWTINSFNFTKPNRVCTNRYGIYNQGGVWQYITMIVLLQEPFECVKVLYTLYIVCYLWLHVFIIHWKQ